MIVVTTPMCRKIVEWAGLKEFKVNKHPDEEEGDLAILLSESEVKMDALRIKLNTFTQIRESILKVSEYCFEHDLIDKLVSNDEIDTIFNSYNLFDLDEIRVNNAGKSVKVYSEFLKDIVLDIGAEVIDFDFNKDGKALEDYGYVVYPDYLKEIVNGNEDFDSSLIFIEIPSHGSVSKDPVERAKERYSILIDGLI